MKQLCKRRRRCACAAGDRFTLFGARPVKIFSRFFIAMLLAAGARAAAVKEALAAPHNNNAGDLPPAMSASPSEEAVATPRGEGATEGSAEIIPQPVVEGDEEHLQSYLGQPMEALEG